jgi:hypothetical protein
MPGQGPSEFSQVVMENIFWNNCCISRFSYPVITLFWSVLDKQQQQQQQQQAT